MDLRSMEEQKMTRKMARELAAEEIAPIAAEINETSRFPREVIKIASSFLVLALVLSLALTPAITNANANLDKSEAAGFELPEGTTLTICGKGFLLEYEEENRPPILHVQGTPYEMGYQHGYLLADRMTGEIGSRNISPVYAMFGGWVPDGVTCPTQEQMQAGYDTLVDAYYAYFDEAIKTMAPEPYEGMQGMADGLAAAGYPTPLEEILMPNCLPDVTGIIMYWCSNFAAWGEATEDNKLVHGVNWDYETYGVLQDAIVAVIAKPDSGYSFYGVTGAGLIGLLGGMNEEGITTGIMSSTSANIDLEGLPLTMQTTKVLQNADSVDAAYDILSTTGGTLGWNYLVTDGIGAGTPNAVVIEVSGNETAIRYEDPDLPDAIWSTNHYNCYPGWQGYEGHNMVPGQAEIWDVPWEEVDTVEKWHAWLEASDIWGATGQRYDRYRELITESLGNIDVSKAIEFQSNPVLSYTTPVEELAPECEQWDGVMAPIVSQNLVSAFSCIYEPGDGMAWLAVGAKPAQAGTYYPISLTEHLQLLEGFSLSPIQAAIDAAGPGNTIYVAAGTYEENIEIPQGKENLSLIGEDRENTIISGPGDKGPVVMIMADGVTFSGFTVKGGTMGSYDEPGYGVGIFGASDCIIEDNIITGNEVGIGITGGVASNTKIQFNNIEGNLDYGVYNEDTGILDATYNWWSDASGPYHPTTNPDATGDAVSDNVNHWLWLASPIDEPQGAQGPQGEQGPQGAQGPQGGIGLSIAALVVAVVAIGGVVYAVTRKKA